MRKIEEAEVCTSELEQQFGQRLHSVVLFGSVARQEDQSDSDIDLLVVLEGLPRGRYARHQLLDSVYHKMLEKGCHTPINVHLKTPEEAQYITLMYLDFPQDARLLFDRGGFFKRILERVEEKIRAAGAIKKRWGKFHYWDLKPGAHAEETFDIL